MNNSTEKRNKGLVILCQTLILRKNYTNDDGTNHSVSSHQNESLTIKAKGGSKLSVNLMLNRFLVTYSYK